MISAGSEPAKRRDTAMQARAASEHLPCAVIARTCRSQRRYGRRYRAERARRNVRAKAESQKKVERKKEIREN